MLKKALSFLIAFIISIGIIPVSVSSAESQTLAEFSFTTGVSGNGVAATNSDKSISATDGVFSSSKLLTSINGFDIKALKFNDVLSDYFSGTGSTNGYVPSLIASTSNLWQNPYAEVEVPTAGYENITFSVNIGGTKKAPRDWKLQYSADGVNYTDSDNKITLSTNKKMYSFSASLPSVCNNLPALHLRLVPYSYYMISGTLSWLNSSSGQTAFNNFTISGTKRAVSGTVSSSVVSGTSITSTKKITLSSSNSTDNIYYTLSSEPQVVHAYSASFSPFENCYANTVTVTAWTENGSLKGDKENFTYILTEAIITKYLYTSSNLTSTYNKIMHSTSGVYSSSALLYAQSSETQRVVPLWNSSQSALSVSPDDGRKWGKGAGFTLEFSAAGFKNISVLFNSYASSKGPASAVAKISTDGESWSDISKIIFSTKKMNTVEIALPSIADNCAKVYFRIYCDTDKRADSYDFAPLFGNESKGDLFFNSISIAGNNDSTAVKMPYCACYTDSFTDSDYINIYSPSSAKIYYNISDCDGRYAVKGNEYPVGGIHLADFVEGYGNILTLEAYSVGSAVMKKTFFYSGKSFSSLSPTSTTFSSEYNSETSTLSGNNLSLFFAENPFSEVGLPLEFTSSYGIKYTDSDLNINFLTSNGKKIKDKIDLNSCWKMKLSTKGYNSVYLTLKQRGNNSAPRDWSLAYSTGGDYTLIDNSDISLQTTGALYCSYLNFNLPQELNNCENVTLILFVNGGETIKGGEIDELTASDTLSENGISSISLSGTKAPALYDVNGDGKITLTDSVLLSRFIADWDNIKIHRYNSDTNEDGKLNTADTILILRYLARK